MRGLVFSQRVLLALIQAGMNREDACSTVQRTGMHVWASEDDDFRTLLADDPEVEKRLTPEHLDSLFDYGFYTGHVDTILMRLED